MSRPSKLSIPDHGEATSQPADARLALLHARRPNRAAPPAQSAHRSLRFQIADELRQQLLSGQLAVGSQLPSEPDLARTLHVSRSSLRAAIALLEQEGLVRRVHGSGTYVTERPLLRNDLSRNLSVSAMIAVTGQVPGARLVETCTEVAPDEVASALNLPAGAEVTVLRRVRTADGEPVVDTVDWCRADVLDEAAMARVRDGSVYSELELRGLRVQYGIAQLRPIVADAALAERLAVAEGAPLLALMQVDSTEDGTVVLVSLEIYRDDAVLLSVYRNRAGVEPDAAG